MTAPHELSRRRYDALFGPTTGDRIRLGDTNLVIEVEDDRTRPGGRSGDEIVFGGGKVVRDAMGQSRVARDGGEYGTPDLVISGALILDHWGVVKADIGIRDGRICGIGKAGNPDTMDGVDPHLVIGPATELASGEGQILTAGGIDCHVHLIAPELATEALAAGITTMVGGGTGPVAGTNATTITPGKWNLERMALAMDAVPVNLLLLGKGNTTSREGLLEQLRWGAGGFKIHEDWGSTPAVIDACLRAAEETGVQVAIHTDTLNEAGFVESTLEAIHGRSINTYHTEGAGGGHAPDIITVVSAPNVLPSSTNPTRPLTADTIDEHLDMLMVCHHLSSEVPEDLAFAESRIRPTTIAAEDFLQDSGAISMMSSDSLAMGRIGEVITRTWQTAHVMKDRIGALPGDGATGPDGRPGADNVRAKRYVAKYTINPALAHGMAGEIGSVEVGKLADLVLWDPRFFGIRPAQVFKGGQVAWSQVGEANASIPTTQPVLPRPMYGAAPAAAAANSVIFVAPVAAEHDIAADWGIRRRAVPVADTRHVTKADMVNNTATPDVRVDPDSFSVYVDGRLIEAEPVEVLPLAQRYTLF